MLIKLNDGLILETEDIYAMRKDGDRSPGPVWYIYCRDKMFEVGEEVGEKVIKVLKVRELG